MKKELKIKRATEKMLKNFLKNKRYGFTVGLLVTFLITGALVWGVNLPGIGMDTADIASAGLDLSVGPSADISPYEGETLRNLSVLGAAALPGLKGAPAPVSADTPADSTTSVRANNIRPVDDPVDTPADTTPANVRANNIRPVDDPVDTPADSTTPVKSVKLPDLTGDAVKDIAAMKAELEALIAANGRKIASLKQEENLLIREADWYSKPAYLSTSVGLFSSYKTGDKIEDKWVAPTRVDSGIDLKRKAFEAAVGGANNGGGGVPYLRPLTASAALAAAASSEKQYVSSGWLTGDSQYSENTDGYDYEDSLMVLPIVQAPEAAKPDTPKIVFSVPAAPQVVELAKPEVLILDIGSVGVPEITVEPPVVDDVDKVSMKALAEIKVSDPKVEVKPITVDAEVSSPEFNISAPTPSVQVTVMAPASVEEPNPTVPDIDIKPVEPSATPFTGYYFNGANSAISTPLNPTGLTIYAGIDPKDIGKANPTLKLETGALNSDGSPYKDGSTNQVFATRPTNILYRTTNATLLSGFDLHVAGFDGNTSGTGGSYTDAGTAHDNGVLGTVGLHSSRNKDIENVNVYLYGRAGFLTSESWTHGKVTMDNVNIKVYGSDNTVVYVMPSAYASILKYLGQTISDGVKTWMGGALGESNINIYGTGNNVYLTVGISAVRRTENSGTVKIEGASNIYYSSMSYAPTWKNFNLAAANESPEPLVSSIMLTTPAEIYGDENVGIFFGSKMKGTMPASWETSHITVQDTLVNRRASYIGIYQGEIAISANIGAGLAIASDAAIQTDAGRITAKENDTYGYSAATVDGVMGIYAKSGQRPGIIPTKHLGVPSDNSLDYSYYNNDAIHNLMIGNIDIRFGKYAKNGLMVVSDLGTVIDIGKSATTEYVKTLSTEFTDGINGKTTVEADAATGTIIAYSRRTWDQNEHKLGSSLAYGDHTNENAMLPLTDSSIAALQGLPSEINIWIPLTMTAKEGIAYLASDSGVIKVDAAASTTATGHQSIIAAAIDGTAAKPSTITIAGDITAKDAGASSKWYQDIVAYAGEYGTITITGKVDVNGTGALAQGTGAHIVMSNTGNTIQTGVGRDDSHKSNGGLVALDGGKIEFAGTITHQTLDKDYGYGETHANTIPFYADDNGSKIYFTGATTIELHDGAAFYGDANQYSQNTSSIDSTTKYFGMDNVTVNLREHGLSLGVYQGLGITWNGTDIEDVEKNYLGDLAGVPKFHEIKDNDHWYKSYLEGGTFDIVYTGGVNLDGASSLDTKGSDPFNDIVFEREAITIESGVNVKSTKGNGLVMGSNVAANASGKNQDSGYTNKGTIDISGGNKIVAYVNYGHVDNSGNITADSGIAVLGVNGSQLINSGAIQITGDGAIGMAGMARKVKADGTVDDPDDFGTDLTTGTNADNMTALIDIQNSGTIKLGADNGTFTPADNAIGIYAANNIATANTRSRVLVSNTAKIELGDNGVGILVSGAVDGGKITVSTNDTNHLGMKLGKNGIGIYGENSDIKIDDIIYTVELKDNGIGILALGESTITGSAGAKFVLDYKGATNAWATGLVVEGGVGKSNTNALNIEVKAPNGMTNTVSGIYTKGGGDLTNSGDLTLSATNTFGIIADGVDVTNTGTITNGTGATNATNGGIGIYVKDALVTTDGGDLKLEGIGAIGVYAESKALTAEKAITIETSDLNVNGNKAIGVYLKEGQSNKLKLALTSNVNLTAASTENGRKIGAYLDGARNADNKASGNLTLPGTDSTGYNIGIYSKDSYLTKGGATKITGVENIGIYAESTGTAGSTVKLFGATFEVAGSTTAEDDLSIGVYGKGKNVLIDASSSMAGYTVGPNGVGIYLEGDGSSKTTGTHIFNLTSSNAIGPDGAEGIGLYYKGGAYGEGTVTLKSTGTQVKSGNPVRPIGVFYGEGSTKNAIAISVDTSSQDLIGIFGMNLAAFTNNGQIDLWATSIGGYFTGATVTVNGDLNIETAATDAYGYFFRDGAATIASGKTSVIKGDGSIGYVIEKKTKATTLANNGSITASGIDAAGVYVAVGAAFTNESGGEIIASLAKDYGSDLSSDTDDKDGSIAVIAKGGSVVNKGNISTKYVGIYAEKATDATTSADTASTVEVSGGSVKIGQKKGIGILSQDKTVVKLTGGALEEDGAVESVTALYAAGSDITLNGTTITVGKKGIGIYAMNASKVNALSGNITVGENGTAIYGKGSALDLDSYTGTISLGNKGIAVFSEDSTLTSNNGTIKVSYTSSTDKGVGMYFTGTTAVTNTISVNHTGTNFVSLYADGINLTNKAKEEIKDTGVGIYADNGAVVANQGELVISGNDSVGIYLADTNTTGNTVLSAIGKISGSAVTTAGKSKIGVYVKDGDVTGSTDYIFDVDGGVALYLKNNVVSYAGTIQLDASSTSTNKAIGVYVAPTLDGTISTNLLINGAEAIGMFIDATTTDQPVITYTGKLRVMYIGSTELSRTIGVVLSKGSEITLGAGGVVELGDANNVGFYVREGSKFNVAAGAKVINLPGGVLAYIENGEMNMQSGMPDINYANMIVSGALGELTNNATLPVGTKGLQANTDALVVNGTNGVITATIENGKAMAGITGAKLENHGTIKLTGSGSVAIYTEGGATAISDGPVTVGEKSIAYFAALGSTTASATLKGEITISGTTTIGKGSTLIYVKGGEIHYNNPAAITLGDERNILVLEEGSSVVSFSNNVINVGKKGTGVYIKGTGDMNDVSGINSMTIAENGTGIYIANGNTWTDDIDMTLTGANATGLLMTGTGAITNVGKMTSSAKAAKGILLTAGGSIVNREAITLTGEGSIGLYGAGTTVITNDTAGKIIIGSGTDSGAAVAIYGKNTGNINNKGYIEMVSHAVGIYGENAAILNDTGATIKNGLGNNTGIYAKGGSATNHGTIYLCDTSNGIYVENGTAIVNTGSVTVGGAKSSGLYGTGNTKITHTGTIAVGANATGIATEKGDIEVGIAAHITADHDSTYIYTESGKATNKATLALSDYGLGMYTRTGTLVNDGTITTGISYVHGDEQDLSIAMATGTSETVNGNTVRIGGGTIINNGTINVPQKESIGIVANNPTAVATNNGTINVLGQDAYGMVGADQATLHNNGIITVSGQSARGMAASKGATAINEAGGEITVTGVDAQGIYAANNGVVTNHGKIIVDGTGRTGIYLGDGGQLINSPTGTIIVRNGASDIYVDTTGQTAVVGNIRIENKGPLIVVGDTIYDAPTLINGGYIDFIDGTLDFDTIKIGSPDGYIGTISAQSFEKGEFIVLPTATQGNNDPVKIIQYLKGVLNVPNNGLVKAISQSVTWVAAIQADPDQLNVYRIVLAKIPYVEITKGTPAYEFGKGLDAIYNQAKGPELSMFDKIDMISDKDELAAVFDMELRGNLYSNIQTRLLDVNDILNDTREDLLENGLYTRDNLKIGAIAAGGETKDANPGVEDYEYKTAGFMVMEDYALKRFGSKAFWDAAFAATDVDFDFGSKEKIYTLEAGAGYEQLLDKKGRLTWSVRGSANVNNHQTTRKIELGGETYHNKANFYTMLGEIENKIRYEMTSVSGKLKGGIYAGLTMGYGKIKDFKEKGDGIFLDFKEKDLRIIRPEAGVDLTATKYSKKGKLSLTAKASYSRDLHDIYDSPNEVKIAGTDADYYALETPDENRYTVKLQALLKYESKSGHAIGVEVTKTEGAKDTTRYGLRYNYRM